MNLIVIFWVALVAITIVAEPVVRSATKTSISRVISDPTDIPDIDSELPGAPPDNSYKPPPDQEKSPPPEEHPKKPLGEEPEDGPEDEPPETPEEQPQEPEQPTKELPKEPNKEPKKDPKKDQPKDGKAPPGTDPKDPDCPWIDSRNNANEDMPHTVQALWFCLKHERIMYPTLRANWSRLDEFGELMSWGYPDICYRQFRGQWIRHEARGDMFGMHADFDTSNNTVWLSRIKTDFEPIRDFTELVREFFSDFEVWECRP